MRIDTKIHSTNNSTAIITSSGDFIPVVAVGVTASGVVCERTKKYTAKVITKHSAVVLKPTILFRGFGFLPRFRIFSEVCKS